MGGEGPTLSQAEKKRLAAEKQSADAAAREMERVARAEAAQAAARTQSLTTAAPTSKKELKAQQKARKKQLEEERRSALGGKAVAERKPELDAQASDVVDVSEEPCAEPAAGSVRTMGHSTHCAGLKQVMALLAKRAAVKEVMAGKLHEGHGHAPQFEMRLQRDGETANARFKFVARKGHTAQDVLIEFNATWLNACAQSDTVMELVQAEVDVAVDEFNGKCKRTARGDKEKEASTDVLFLGGKNLSGAEMERAAAEKSRAAHKLQHDKAVAKEMDTKQAVAAKQAEKALRAAVRGSSSDGKVDVAAHAERNAALISGEAERGKYSFR